MNQIKLIVVDDHHLFRGGLISLLNKHSDLRVLGEASTGKELFKLLEMLAPNIVLIDISMPGEDGLEVIKIGREKYPNIRFMVITMHDEGQYVVKAVRNGAFSYLLKNTDEGELIEAIRQVNKGQKYFNRRISDLMIGNMAIEGESLKKLSDREMEVLQMVATGKTTKEIADQLCVSNRTVETHRVNMMRKLKVQNSAEMIKKAVTLGLI
jgi:two-component system, NarL family, response regulator NreC